MYTACCGFHRVSRWTGAFPVSSESWASAKSVPKFLVNQRNLRRLSSQASIPIERSMTRQNADRRSANAQNQTAECDAIHRSYDLYCSERSLLLLFCIWIMWYCIRGKIRFFIRKSSCQRHLSDRPSNKLNKSRLLHSQARWIELKSTLDKLELS